MPKAVIKDSEDIKFKVPDFTMSRDSPPHKSNIKQYTSMNFIIKMPQMVISGVAKLKDDGSNYPSWKDDLCVLVDMITKIDDYFAKDCKGTKGNNISVLMIGHSVSPEVRRKINRSKSAYVFFNHINSMFHFPSRLTHLTIWQGRKNSKSRDPKRGCGSKFLTPPTHYPQLF